MYTVAWPNNAQPGDYLNTACAYTVGIQIGCKGVIVSTNKPTAVTLSSFNAQDRSPTAFGRIMLSWTTASEVNTAGFNLYRSERPEGPYTRINSQLIPASADQLIGDKYVYQDNNVSPGKTYYYQLEDVEYNGVSVQHPAISITAASAPGLGAIDGAMGPGWGALAAVAGVAFVILRRRSILRS